MSLDFVSVTVVRTTKTHLGGGEYGEAEAQISGSPFLARVYRVPQTTVGRDEAADGTATLDKMQRLSIRDPACPLAVNDIAFLPRADGSLARAKVVRVRFYADRVQCDLETGAEGNGPPPSLMPALDIADPSSADVAG